MKNIAVGRCAGQIDPRGEPLFTIVVKETFRIDGTRLVPADEPEPILSEERTRPGLGGVEVPVRFPDLVPDKLAADLVVLATVRAAPARPHADVLLSVGGRERAALRVTGQRIAERVGRSIRFSAPEPFEEMPLSWDRAYGGVDAAGEAGAEQAPLAYPRNEIGRGFITADPGRWPEDGLELPNVERQDELLTPGHLVCRSAACWHLQPRPAGMGWMPPVWFPRAAHWSLASWPPPDLRAGPIPEEASGLLPADLTVAAGAEAADFPDLLHPEFFQEAAPGLTIPDLDRVATVELAGLDGDARVSYALPHRRPQVTLRIGRRSLRPQAKLFTFLLDLDESRAIRLWGAPLPLVLAELRELSEDDLLALPVQVQEVG